MTPQQQYHRLLQLIAHRDRVMAKNNARAAVDPRFAALLASSRSMEIDREAAAAVSRAHAAMHGQGLGQAGLIIGGVAAVVLSVLAIAGTYVFYQIWQEERAWQAANPIQASIQSGTKAIWAVVGVGVVVLAGFLYWDYRKRSPSAFTIVDSRPPMMSGGTERLRSDAHRLARQAHSAVHPEYARTRVDPELAKRMEEEAAVEEAFQRAERGEAPYWRRSGDPWRRR